jgi:hypothetical protein
LVLIFACLKITYHNINSLLKLPSLLLKVKFPEDNILLIRALSVLLVEVMNAISSYQMMQNIGQSPVIIVYYIDSKLTAKIGDYGLAKAFDLVG